jgi:TetR/AcrR family transcriptional repressor of nem operon
MDDRTHAEVDEARPRRGRPRGNPATADARQKLLRSGLLHLTERGYSAVGVDEILHHARVPKGSFYHYFRTKDAFGSALIEAYHNYFVAMLESSLSDSDLAPLDRLRRFTREAEAGMARHDFRRGCLLGNLGQEMGALPDAFRQQILDKFEDWQMRTARCLKLAQDAGEVAFHHDVNALAAFFWTGWEGAVLRAKLERGAEPLRLFASLFFDLAQSGKGETHV